MSPNHRRPVDLRQLQQSGRSPANLKKAAWRSRGSGAGSSGSEASLRANVSNKPSVGSGRPSSATDLVAGQSGTMAGLTIDSENDGKPPRVVQSHAYSRKRTASDTEAVSPAVRPGSFKLAKPHTVESPDDDMSGAQEPAITPDTPDPRTRTRPPRHRTRIPDTETNLQPHQTFQPDSHKWDMVLQPQSREISQIQLVAEVDGIENGLCLVEKKCIEVDRAEMARIKGGKSAAPNVQHLQPLIALHRTLLHENHDFFLASQHPSASAALKGRAAELNMPARLWKYGIHNFLELLRGYLPVSMDYLLAFLYLSYQMMALLYETVPTFRETWIECLGDLARYRMALEDFNSKHRETWSGVSAYWYTMAADCSPDAGRLPHHLAILSRTYPLQQHTYYCRALTAKVSFLSTRESIMSLYEPILLRLRSPDPRDMTEDLWYIACHAILFTGGSVDAFTAAVDKFLKMLDPYIGRITTKFKPEATYIALGNISGLMNYGSENSVLGMILRQRESRDIVGPVRFQSTLEGAMHKELRELQDLTSRSARATSLTRNTLTVALNRVGDRMVLGLVHVNLAFLYCLCSDVAYGRQYIQSTLWPWKELAAFLTALARKFDMISNFEAGKLFVPPPGETRYIQLPEDFLMRGQVFCQGYFPDDFFAYASSDEAERVIDNDTTTYTRTHRIFQVALELCRTESWIQYENETKVFWVNPTVSRSATPSSATLSSDDTTPTEDGDTSMSGRDTK